MTKRMTAAQFQSRRKKPRDIEGPIQIEIVDWLRSVLPVGCMVHHCRNEIKRGGDTFAREQAKATRLGSVTGWPDLIVLPFAHIGALFFEVKAPNGRVSEAQTQVHAELAHLGYRVAVVRSVADVRDRLNEWGVGFVEPIEMRGTVE